MKATKVLMDEHRVIERVLAALEVAAGRADRGEAVRPGLFLDACDFIKHFADGCHHHKEEDVLFGAMVDAGLPRDNGPIAVMLNEHEQARAYTRSMRDAAERWGDGDEAARKDAARAARGYAALLRAHIAKEDQVLFPMADRMIPSSDREQVMVDFTRVQSDEAASGVHAKYVALAEAIEQEIGG
jgi:hemerythrin-like domain-containing protein